MFKWYAFLLLLGISVAIFVFAPMGLVGYFIGRFTPEDMEWVGVMFSLGLSLSIVSNSFLARWKTMRIALGSLVILALSEGAMSGATLYMKAVQDGTLDGIVAIGILGIVAMQEAVLISGGLGLSLVLDKIGAENDRLRQLAERRQARQSSRQHDSASDKPASEPEVTTKSNANVATVEERRRRMTRTVRLADIVHANALRNGDGPMTAEQIVARYGVSLRQAQRDVADVAKWETVPATDGVTR